MVTHVISEEELRCLKNYQRRYKKVTQGDPEKLAADIFLVKVKDKDMDNFLIAINDGRLEYNDKTK